MSSRGAVRLAGFTMIELLCVIVIIGSLASSAIPSFIDFRGEGRAASVSSNLSALRLGIKMQSTQGIVSCGKTPGWFPTISALNSNSMVTNPCVDDTCGIYRDCTPAMLPNIERRRIVDSPTIPFAAGSGINVNTVTNGITYGFHMVVTHRTARPTSATCSDTGCTATANACNGTTFTYGWCYLEATGEIWADSNEKAGGTYLCNL